MANFNPVNSGMVNGPYSYELASSTSTDGSHLICAGRNRAGTRYRGASVMFILENNTFDITWVLEHFRAIARIVGRRRD